MAEPIPFPSLDSPAALPRTSIPPGDFSFEKDIAPLQRRFFQQVESSPFLSEAEKSDDVFGLADNLNKLVGERQKLRSQEQTMRLREMQFQSTLLHFETSRARAKEERDMLSSLPEITSQLDTISQDPSMDRIMKKRALARWGVQHAGTLARNPGAKVAYAAAQDGVEVREENPATFAAEVLRLGLDPNSPEVAQMPGASTLGISLAKQGRARDAQILGSKRALEVAEEHNKSLSGALGDMKLVKFQDPNDMDTDSDEDPDPNTFADEKSNLVVETMLLWATPKEKLAIAQAGNDRARYDIARVVHGRMRQQLGGIRTQTGNTRSSFTK